MSPSLRQRLRLVLGGGSGEEERARTPADRSSWAQLVAFTEDRRISAHVRLDSDRLSDTLNAHLEYELCDVLVEDLSSGACVHEDGVLLARDELLAVLTDGPRGDPGRRVRTLAHEVTVKTGPYLVRGNLHTAPGIDPLASARRRRPMIPLSDAWIEFRSGDALMGSVVGTVVVNRATADWIQLGFAPSGTIAMLDPVRVAVSGHGVSGGP